MKAIKIKKLKVELSKLVTMAEMGLGVERPLEDMDQQVEEGRCLGSNTRNTNQE